MLNAIAEAFRALKSGRDPAALLTNKPKFRDSEKDETLQLAERVIGAIGAHLDGESHWFHEIRRGGRNLGVVQLASCRSFPTLDDFRKVCNACENGKTVGRASRRSPGPQQNQWNTKHGVTAPCKTSPLPLPINWRPSGEKAMVKFHSSPFR